MDGQQQRIFRRSIMDVSKKKQDQVFKAITFKKEAKPVKIFKCSDADVYSFSGNKSEFAPGNTTYPFEVQGQEYSSVLEFIRVKMFLELTSHLPRVDLGVGYFRQFRDYGGTDEKRENWILSDGLQYLQLAYLNKCKQHPEFVNQLKSTGADSIIVYSYVHDNFFGAGETFQEVKKWKAYNANNNMCVSYPTAFPLKLDDLYGMPRIIDGYNVLGAILMALRDKLLSGTPLSALSVLITDNRPAPLITMTHPTFVSPASKSNSMYRHQQQMSSPSSRKRRRNESGLSSVSSLLPSPLVVHDTGSSPQPRGDLLFGGSFPAMPHQFFRNFNSSSNSRPSNNGSLNSREPSRLSTPLSILERFHLTTPFDNKASSRIDTPEQITTYSLMNTPEPCQRKQSNEEENDGDVNQQNMDGSRPSSALEEACRIIASSISNTSSVLNNIEHMATRNQTESAANILNPQTLGRHNSDPTISNFGKPFIKKKSFLERLRSPGVRLDKAGDDHYSLFPTVSSSSGFVPATANSFGHLAAASSLSGLLQSTADMSMNSPVASSEFSPLAINFKNHLFTANGCAAIPTTSASFGQPAFAKINPTAIESTQSTTMLNNIEPNLSAGTPQSSGNVQVLCESSNLSVNPPVAPLQFPFASKHQSDGNTSQKLSGASPSTINNKSSAGFQAPHFGSKQLEKLKSCGGYSPYKSPICTTSPAAGSPREDKFKTPRLPATLRNSHTLPSSSPSLRPTSGKSKKSKNGATNLIPLDFSKNQTSGSLTSRPSTSSTFLTTSYDYSVSTEMSDDDLIQLLSSPNSSFGCSPARDPNEEIERIRRQTRKE